MSRNILEIIKLSTIQQAALNIKLEIIDLESELDELRYGNREIRPISMIKETKRKIALLNEQLHNLEAAETRYDRAQQREKEDALNIDQIGKTVEGLKKFADFMQAMEQNDELADAVVNAIDGYASTVLSLADKMAPGLTKLGVKVIRRYAGLASTVAKAVDANKDELEAAFKEFDAALQVIAPRPETSFDDLTAEDLAEDRRASAICDAQADIIQQAMAAAHQYSDYINRAAALSILHDAQLYVDKSVNKIETLGRIWAALVDVQGEDAETRGLRDRAEAVWNTTIRKLAEETVNANQA